MLLRMGRVQDWRCSARDRMGIPRDMTSPLPICIALGTCLGAAFGDVALGLVLGVAIGAALEQRRSGGDAPPNDSPALSNTIEQNGRSGPIDP